MDLEKSKRESFEEIVELSLYFQNKGGRTELKSFTFTSHMITPSLIEYIEILIA